MTDLEGPSVANASCLLHLIKATFAYFSWAPVCKEAQLSRVHRAASGRQLVMLLPNTSLHLVHHESVHKPVRDIQVCSILLAYSLANV